MNNKEKISNFLLRNGDRIALLIILVVAFLLRFWQLWEVPFMHDEFSALFRTRFDSFHQLISDGVKSDSHPAGVQIFLYYWVKLFGFHEFWIKLPFALTGFFSVWLVISIGTKWFNRTTGLITGALTATMQFFVFYSQIARPYAVGLFFILLAVYWWTKILVEKKDTTFLPYLFLALSLLMASLMQYFSMLLAGLIYLSGFILLQRQQMLKYLISGVVAALLYLPHLPVFLLQISNGGIGGWLGAPHAGFIVDFMFYAFHFSWLFTIGSVIILIFFIQWPIRNKQNHILRLIGFSWFAISFLVAFLYSVFRTPILQYSTLIFSFPFLLLSLFSFSHSIKPGNNLLITIIVLCIGAYTLIGNRNHYEMMYQQGYDQIAEAMADDFAKYGKNVSFAAVGGSTEMISFYMEKKGLKDVRLFNKYDHYGRISNFADSVQTDYMAVAWTDYASFEWIESVRSRFETVIDHNSWFNSEYFLLARTKNFSERRFMEGERTVILEMDSVNEVAFDGKQEYGMLWEAKGDSVFRKGDAMVVSSVSGMAIDTLTALRLVLEFKLEGDKSPVYWMAGVLPKTGIRPGQEFSLSASYRFDSGSEHIKWAKVRTYVWNQGRENFLIKKRLIYLRPHDPRLLGLYAPL
ncbi:MAG: hypothetical protein CVT92_13490 [Bacteroidetes bacterium HGW-Bacteroidetes-1]|nr:MAG: hypothetical protein CVT92_13490 [Bacteroidetes bacterium HGW-Bacteroidetes-1]